MSSDPNVLLTKAMVAKRLRQLEDIREACEGSLLDFFRTMWPVIEPVEEFVPGWALSGIAEHLEGISYGQIRRLLITVPPGFSKPVCVDEPVLTKRGRIRLGDVVVGDKVLTHRGRYRDVEAVHAQGKQETLTMTTFAGRKVKAELSHPFLTTRGWVPAKDLKVGDVLGAVVPQEEGMLDRLTPEEARFLGYMVGDGAVTHSPTFTNMDDETLIDFEECAKSIGLVTHRRRLPPSRLNKNPKASLIGIQGALPFLERHGLRGKDSYGKRIPIDVLASSAAILQNFLAAYWSCDGMVRVRHQRHRGAVYFATCCTVSRGLAYDIQHALLRLGIDARVRLRVVNKNYSKKQPGNKYEYYIVESTSHEEVIKFQQLTKMVSRKRLPIDVLTPQKFVQGPLVEDEIISIDSGGMAECRCLTVEEDHSFTASDLAVHNSIATSVMFPTWEWGPRGRPDMRYLLFSYAEELSLRDNGRARDIIESEEFKMHWGETFEIKKERDAKHYYENDHMGWRYATSIGGRTTGFRAQRLIIDDPHNIKDVESDTKRETAVRWFHESLPNRLAKQDRDAIIVIMQRSHESDVAGSILSDELDYTHLNIPMHYDSTRHCVTTLAWEPDGTPTQTWEDPRTEDGELAWPERFPESAIAELTKEMGPYAIAGQYEQAPTPRGGGIIQRSWWQYWPPEGHPERETLRPEMPACEFVIASLDTALLQAEENDFSAMTIWGVFREQTGRRLQPTPRLIVDNGQMIAMDDSSHPKVILMYGWQKKLYLRGPTEPEDMVVAKGGCSICGATPWAKHSHDCTEYLRLRQTLWGVVEWTMYWCKKMKVDLLLIEAQGRGIDTAEEIRKQIVGQEEFGVEVVRPVGDKVARVHAVQHLFSNGRVYAPQIFRERDGWVHPVWCAKVIDEVSVFPKGAHDDLCDTMSASLLNLREKGLLLRKDESIVDIESEYIYKPKRQALYDT